MEGMKFIDIEPKGAVKDVIELQKRVNRIWEQIYMDDKIVDSLEVEDLKRLRSYILSVNESGKAQ